jgi:hypothetical protein
VRHATQDAPTETTGHLPPARSDTGRPPHERALPAQESGTTSGRTFRTAGADPIRSRKETSMRRTTVKLTILAAAAALLPLTQPADAALTGVTAHRGAAAPEAYFEFDYPPASDKVVFKLTDTAKIQEARNIINGTQKDKTHVMGKIVKRAASYNTGWSFHLDPATINFFQAAIEVCDAAPRYVEDHLDEAGGAFLPGAYWCPWGSRLLREVPAPQAS